MFFIKTENQPLIDENGLIEVYSNISKEYLLNNYRIDELVKLETDLLLTKNLNKYTIKEFTQVLMDIFGVVLYKLIYNNKTSKPIIGKIISKFFNLNKMNLIDNSLGNDPIDIFSLIDFRFLLAILESIITVSDIYDKNYWIEKVYSKIDINNLNLTSISDYTLHLSRLSNFFTYNKNDKSVDWFNFIIEQYHCIFKSIMEKEKKLNLIIKSSPGKRIINNSIKPNPNVEHNLKNAYKILFDSFFEHFNNVSCSQINMNELIFEIIFHSDCDLFIYI